MKKTLYIFLVILIFSCSDKNDYNTIEVGYKGALKDMMQKADITSKTNLSQFEGTENLYALGAIEKLKGEIQIFDGKPINSFHYQGQIKIDSSFSKKATLLVYATVENWIEEVIPSDVTSYTKLETYIKRAAKENGINVKEPFPFLLSGTIQSLDWHIIDWQEGDMEHTHEKHKTSGPHGTLKNEDVLILGFYSDSHKGIFTHHTTKMHLHMKTISNNLAGHVDNLTLNNGMILKVPAQNEINE